MAHEQPTHAAFPVMTNISQPISDLAQCVQLGKRAGIHGIDLRTIASRSRCRIVPAIR
jgi:hypothetical protein